jgi:ABC-2 type transport system permease protein
VRRKGYLFATFGLPVIIFLLMLAANALSSLTQQDNADIAQQFDFGAIKAAGYVDQSGLFATVPPALADVLTRYPDEAAARAAMQSGAIQVFYVIAADYLTSGEVTQHVPGFSIDLLNSGPIDQLVYSTLAPNASPAALLRLNNPANFQEFNLERSSDAGAQNEDSDFLLVYVFSLVFLMALFITNGYLMQSVIEEKETRLIEILMTSVRPVQLLAGKILALSTLGIFQIVVWMGALLLAVTLAGSLPVFATATALLNVQFPLAMLPVILLYFILGYLFFAAIYSAIGAISSSIREGPQYAAFLTIPAVIPFYFFPMFIETPNATLPVAMSIFPITAPIAMMMRLTLTTVPPLELLLSLGLLALSVGLVIWLAGRMFRVQTLLAGTTPSLRDLPRLLRG